MPILWGMVILTKVFVGRRFWGRWHFFSVAMPCIQILPHIFFLTAVRTAGGTFQLIQCPPNLHVPFNKIISEVQDCEAAGRSASYGP